MSFTEGKFAAGVVKRWYPTICYKLCLNGPSERPLVALRYDNRVNSVGASTLGWYDSDKREITIQVGNGEGYSERDYLFTLAHETFHAWQHVYRVAPTEDACDDWAREFIARNPLPCHDFIGSPICGEPYYCTCGTIAYHGYKCRACADARAGRLERERRESRERIRRARERKARESKQSATRHAPESGTAQESPHRVTIEQLDESSDLNQVAKAAEGGLHRPSSPKSFVVRALDRLAAAARERSAAKVGHVSSLLHAIDNNPNNGENGYWLVAEIYYVPAVSAPEAVMRVQHLLDGVPSVRLVGTSLPK